MNYVTPPDTRLEVIEAVLNGVDDGKSLAQICREIDFPRKTFEGWLDGDPDLAARYARARENRAEKIFEQILEISDNPKMGTIETAKEWGTEVQTRDMIEHRRLQVDSRKWMLARMHPRKYGDRLALDHAGKIDTNAPDLTKLSGEELAQFRALAAKAQPDAPPNA